MSEVINAVMSLTNSDYKVGAIQQHKEQYQEQQSSQTPDQPKHTEQHQNNQVPTSDLDGNSEEKRFDCPHCDHKFTRKHNLKSHLLIHTREKPFSCSICSSKFRRLHDLKRHEKLHTGAKPYQCQNCGRNFARADALARHSNSQSGCTFLVDDSLIRNRLHDYEDDGDVADSASSTTSSIDNDSSYRKHDCELNKLRVERSNHRITTLITQNESIALPPPIPSSTASTDNSKYDLLPYVRLLESRVSSLETKLSETETKLTQLTYQFHSDQYQRD